FRSFDKVSFMQMLASMTWAQWLVALLIIVICCFFMLVILLQRGRGGGLAGAFGGAGGSSAFGAKTGDVFTWITVVMAAVLLVVCCLANFMLEPRTDGQVFAADTTIVPPPETTAPPADSQIEQWTYDGNALSIDSPETTGAGEATKPQPESGDGTGGSDEGSEDPSTP
ncbi:MAG: preprotein translocase subunit SecG, partial [Planctomycetes bacterium]|nr:preprotein translocase subunit SecG [Planctomycetota bacterium]